MYGFDVTSLVNGSPASGNALEASIPVLDGPAVLLAPPQPAAASTTTKQRRTSLRIGARIATACRASAEDAGVAERVAARLRPDAQPVRAAADGNPRKQVTGRRADRVDLAAPPPREPEHRAVGGDVAHVRTAAGDVPRLRDTARAERDDGDRPRGAVRHVEVPGVAAWIEAVRPRARRQEAQDTQIDAVDEPDAARGHVGDVEDLAVGRELHVLRRCAGAQLERAEDPLVLNIELEEHARELTADDRVAPIRREVHVVGTRARNRQRPVQRKRVRVAKVEAVQPLGDDDRVAPVGREVHVVWIVDWDR